MEEENDKLVDEDVFDESFDSDEDSDDYSEEDYDDNLDDSPEEELFRENPLKAIWIRLGEIKEIIDDN